MIKITEKLYLDADKENWIVGEPYLRLEKDGSQKESLRNCTYFTDLGIALRNILERNARMTIGKYDNLEDLINIGMIETAKEIVQKWQQELHKATEQAKTQETDTTA